jgi:hypothetical protein
MYMSSCARLKTLMDGKPVMKCSRHMSISAVQSTWAQHGTAQHRVMSAWHRVMCQHAAAHHGTGQGHNTTKTQVGAGPTAHNTLLGARSALFVMIQQ